jgi:K+-transporting ATPase c subunit
MLKNISKTFLLIFFAILICCVMYPALLWAVGKVFFPFQAEGSVLYGPTGKPIGSALIAQPFTRDEYFQPRPSAASYNASASSSAALAASNPALRTRVSSMLGPIVTYKSGPKAGQLVGPDIEQWIKNKNLKGSASMFFDQWRQENPNVSLQDVPGDMVTTSASGLDPHITLENAQFQLDRIAGKWAELSHSGPMQVRAEIQHVLDANAFAPLRGLVGEKMVNVLKVNLELQKRFKGVF